MGYDSFHLDVYFRRFGKPVVYLSGAAGSVAKTISGIVEEPGTTRIIGSSTMQVVKRQVTVKTSDVSSPSMNDVITIDGIEYDVVGYNPDGTGMTVLVLASDGR